MRAPRCEQVPHAVADHHGVLHAHAQTPGARHEQIRIRLGVFDLVPGDDRDVGGNVEPVERGLGGVQASTGPDGPGYTDLREIREQLPRAREGTNLVRHASECLPMHLLDPPSLFRLQVATGLPEQRFDEKPAAHADAAMDAPHRELDAGALERFAPGEDVLIHAVDERAVEIEEERGTGGHGAIVLRLPPRRQRARRLSGRSGACIFSRSRASLDDMTTSPTCTKCGEPIGPTDRFCARCGADVSGVQANVATEVVSAEGGGRTATQPSALLETLRRATVGEYEVLAELGRGGMATVFLAHDIALERKVAIKVMSPALLSDPEFAERFKREARTAASLSHPSIIPIYAVKEGEHLMYFVMKFIEGRPLDSIIKEVGPLPIPMVQAILNQVGAALGYAHKRRVVHRDVKPANIMVDSDGWAIVTDFGIAKGSESHGLTVTGATVGTPSYMSPEQCGAKELTGASDQYSLGVVAYEMLAGRLPFAADSVMAIMYAHFNEVPAPVTNLRPEVPAGLAGAVMRMLEKEPGKRWPSLEAALAAVGGAPLAHDDPIRTHLVTLAAAGAASQLAKRISTPVSPMPAVKSGAGKTSNIAALSIAPRRTTIAVGGAVQLSATTRRISGTTQPGHGITWASTNTEVVTVSSSGLATAIGPGIATVTATQENTSATATITVTAAEQERRRVWPAVAAGVVLVGAAGAAWWLKPWQGTGAGTPLAEPSRPSARAETTVVAPPPPPPPKHAAQPGKRQVAVPPHKDTVSPQQAAPLLPPAPAPAPAPVPAPPPAPPPAASSTATVPPAPPPPPDPRPQIEAAIASYAKALQARDINAVKRIAPGLGPQALNNLQDFFQRVTGLKANLQVNRVDVNGDQGGADVSGTLEYVNNGTRVTQPLNFHATLERRAEGWRIMQLQ